MKKLLILLFSFFLLSSPSVFADDIYDLDIEGVSIGDSLLDYMSEEEIFKEIEFTKDWYLFLNEPNKYSEVKLLKNLNTFDNLAVFIKNTLPNKYVSNKNEKYFILGIRGVIFYDQDFDGCKQERDEIIEIFSKILTNTERIDIVNPHPADSSGNSIEDIVFLDNSPYESTRIVCTDWDESITNKYNWIDNLSVLIESEEIINWFSDY